MFSLEVLIYNLTFPLSSRFNWFFIKWGGLHVMRQVWRSRYLLFNWAYSTNHKRISINYFWFVLFAGVVGMVLATIIRLEMAYPGVGILAGDNAQYLSIVTAHGVIMVFFMAMPMLFGFFGNFLLPTQMGVHDVAFPRMNSAAFWFLPASLLALCQLVCIDRRYQRMNCFNIRELQGLLRNRFFEEIAPSYLSTNPANTSRSLKTVRAFTSTHAENFEYSTLGSNNLVDSLWNPTPLSISGRDMTLTNYHITTPIKAAPSLYNSILRFGFFTGCRIFTFFYELIVAALFTIKSLLFIFMPSTFITSVSSFFSLVWLRLITTTVQGLPIFFFRRPLGFVRSDRSIKTESIYETITSATHRQGPLSELVTGLGLFATPEINARSLAFDNPEILYKIKTGNYLPDELTRANFTTLITSLNFKSINGYKADWFMSENTYNLIKSISAPGNLFNFFEFTKHNGVRTADSSVTLNSSTLIEHLTTLNLNSLFFAQAKQARVLNNWRSLKLSREGWRCRLLSARHQRSLFRRYVNENELIWVVERNAKDLLPGWAMITPFSSRTRYTLIGKTDIGIAIVTVTLIASMISSANFLMTYRYLSTLNNRKMRDARSFFTESVIVASWMMIAANPMLILGLLMLLSDRHWKTSFFDYSGGGDTILFQHMFWFFGHPEVYIIILPCFGFTNTLISFYLRKRISARASLLYSLYTIAFLGFFVWGHHMYMVGLAHTTRMLYSTLTVMISVPAATKIMHWLVTFVNSAIHFELPFILSLFFIFYFVSGGISGMAVAHTGMSILFHDTFYVIGHFHVMLAGSLMFAGFAAFYFYLPSLFGVRYSRIFAYLHIFYYSVGQLFTVIPMIWLGYLGMPRRVLDYPAALGGWHSLVSSAHMITVSGILAFVIMLFDSLRKQKAYTIKTFGVGRYNTRLNFFLYQIARNNYWLSKHFALMPIRMVQHSKNTTNVHNLEYLESSAFYYSFKPRDYGKNWLYL
uniref:Cytochrome c oxidase subunit 1 n=2 Tax=Euplotes vannus TaxID=5939 RepID=A0A8A9WP65_EUPVA|nr:cytochrome c oxidase subunit 1 [Euplotes vannus]